MTLALSVSVCVRTESCKLCLMSHKKLPLFPSRLFSSPAGASTHAPSINRLFTPTTEPNRRRRGGPSGNDYNYRKDGRLYLGEAGAASRLDTRRSGGWTRRACSLTPCPRRVIRVSACERRVSASASSRRSLLSTQKKGGSCGGAPLGLPAAAAESHSELRALRSTADPGAV